MATLCLSGRLEIGVGRLKNLAGLVAAQGATKVIIVIYSFLAKEPLSIDKKVGAILKEDNIEFKLFS